MFGTLSTWILIISEIVGIYLDLANGNFVPYVFVYLLWNICLSKTSDVLVEVINQIQMMQWIIVDPLMQNQFAKFQAILKTWLSFFTIFSVHIPFVCIALPKCFANTHKWYQPVNILQVFVSLTLETWQVIRGLYSCINTTNTNYKYKNTMLVKLQQPIQKRVDIHYLNPVWMQDILLW